MSKFKVQIKSIFEQISQQVFAMKSLTEVDNIIEFVNSKDIDNKDKITIVRTLRECPNVKRIQSYVCNSLLKYEGLSVNKYDSDKKEVVEEG